MKEFLIVLIAVMAVAFTVLLVSYICFRMTFYAKRSAEEKTDEMRIPPGKVYEPHRETMLNWMKETREIPHEKVSITSFDGLKLRGKYYEYEKGAVIELMFPGYRGEAERDLCGGVQRCFALKRSALVVDQRACGESEGNVITFGVNEHRDCLAWVDFMISHFGEDVRIILTGISMGAATVLIASGEKLPKNVIGVIADCGFTSARDIIKKVIRDMKLPPVLAYPFVKLGARLYGGFDLEEKSPIEAVKRCTVPVFFAHGDNDDFVPFYMSEENYNACPTKKEFLRVKGAGHGLGYIIAPDAYIETLSKIFDE